MDEIYRFFGVFHLLVLLLGSGCTGNQEERAFLPEPVPYCGPEEDYFLGGGIAGARGTTHGQWNFLIGPNYTSPDFLSREVLSVRIGDREVLIDPEMHRARGTGMFYGALEIGEIRLFLLDFSAENQPWVARQVRVENHSRQEIRLSVRASIIPQDGEASIVNEEAISIHADTSRWNFDTLNKESKNWSDRYSVITFNTGCRADQRGEEYVLKTIEAGLPADSVYLVTLYHYQHYREEGKTHADYISYIRNRNGSADLSQSIGQWKLWMEQGLKYPERMFHPKAWDAIEGSLVMVKMLQDSSGGIIAGLGEYPHSYVRDSHGACRLFSITGHNEELKKVIQIICRKRNVFGYIPNAWQMGADQFHYREFHNGAAESPAYFVLMIKYYLENTGDIEYVESIYPYMKDAIDVQLTDMSDQGWLIDFNGDETERYTCRADGETYGILSDWADDLQSANWSLPSCVLALASTEFFTGYLDRTGRSGLAREYEQKAGFIRKSIDSTFWREDLGIHDWCRKRDGGWPQFRIPNYHLFPAWIGVKLAGDRQKDDALNMKQYLRQGTGYLPTAPGDVEGFSGHNLAYMLYVLKQLDDPEADQVFNTLMHAPILSCWGTVSEFYGPGAVPNGHLLNPYSSGIMGEALLKYSIGF